MIHAQLISAPRVARTILLLFLSIGLAAPQSPATADTPTPHGYLVSAAAGADDGAVVAYDPPKRVRSNSAIRDAKLLTGSPRRLKRYVPRYVSRALKAEQERAGSSLPDSCTRTLLLRVHRYTESGWAYVDQKLVNAASCSFDASQRVVLKASTGGRGRVVARLGSGGAPDCGALDDSGVPAGLVPGC